jgi:hypothetical protein
MSPQVPATWGPEQIEKVAALRSGLGSTDVVAIRNELEKNPAAEYPESVKLTAVMIPRVGVPGLEEKATGEIRAEWLEPKDGKGDEPVLIYVHGG